MPTVSLSTMYQHMPLTPYLFLSVTVITGRLVNGIHQVIAEPAWVTLALLERPAMCKGCGRTIEAAEIAGIGSNPSEGTHCSACCNAPKDVEAWEISFRQKVSMRCPKGINRRVIVHTGDVFAQYVADLQNALDREVTVRKLEIKHV